jgi:hypothetical protein
VVETRCGFGLLHKAAHALLIGCDGGRKNSKRYVASSSVSRARYTSPIPPAPMCERIS